VCFIITAPQPQKRTSVRGTLAPNHVANHHHEAYECLVGCFA